MITEAGSTGARLVSVGAARPANSTCGAELGAPFGKDGDWIETRTGIRGLRRLPDRDRVADLAVEAGQQALADDPDAGDGVDLVVTASCSSRSGDVQGEEIARRLAPNAAWFEINAACSGFSYALGCADAAIRSGSARRVLVVASEQMSRLVDPTDLGTSIIFGDGAGAAVVAATDEGTGIGPLVCGSDGSQAHLIACDAGGKLRMEGRAVYRWAVETVPSIAAEACALAGVSLADISVFVPHQANLRIIDAVVQRLGLSRALIATDVVTSGNTSAASIPMALRAMAGRLPTAGRALALLVGFGAGLSWAGQVVELPTPR